MVNLVSSSAKPAPATWHTLRQEGSAPWRREAEGASVATTFDLSGKSILVTGAGRGLGRALSIGAAQAGADVAAFDIDALTLAETRAAEPTRITAHVVDIADRTMFMAAAARGRTLIRPVGDGLAAIGLDPATVLDVIITYMHYDHAGNVALFPGARFHLQDAEMAYCTGRAMAHQHLSAPFAAENVVEMVRRVYEGRVVFHAGDDTLCPGVTLHHPGGHTLGLQAVRVDTARGPIVLASDAGPSPAASRALGRARLR